MSAYHSSLLAWGPWLILVVASFLVLEVLALKDVGPWNTLTWTIRQTMARSQLFGLIFFGLLAVFGVHIAWKRGKKDEQEGDR